MCSYWVYTQAGRAGGYLPRGVGEAYTGWVYLPAYPGGIYLLPALSRFLSRYGPRYGPALVPLWSRYGPAHGPWPCTPLMDLGPVLRSWSPLWSPLWSRSWSPLWSRSWVPLMVPDPVPDTVAGHCCRTPFYGNPENLRNVKKTLEWPTILREKCKIDSFDNLGINGNPRNSAHLSTFNQKLSERPAPVGGSLFG